MKVEKNNKGKVIIFSCIGGAVLIIILAIIYVVSKASGSSEEEEGGKPPILSSQDNLTVKDMIDINGGNENDYRGNKNLDSIRVKDNTAQYNAQIENIYGVGTPPKSNYYQQSTPAPSTPKNSHNVYGDYSMWENKEPANSRIGYNSKKKNPEPTRSADPPKFETVLEPNYSQPVQSYSQPVEKKSTQVAQAKAKLISQGYAVNNKSISFVLLETFSLNGEQIVKGKSYASGTIKMERDRLYAKINSIKANGKTYPVNGKIIGFDGDDGLPISAGESSDIDGAGIVKDEAVNQVGRIPIVGGIIRRVSGSGSARTNSDKVALSNNIEVQIVIYN